MKDELVQDLGGAIRIIDNCAGFSDEGSAAGEAWLFIQNHIANLERQLAELREAAHGLLGALSNGSFMPSPNWPTVVFEGALKVYLENRAEVERLLEE